MIIKVAQQRSADGFWAKLCPTTTADYALRAMRPLYTAMDTSKIESVFGVRMSAWEEQFRTFLVSLPAHLYSGAAIHHD
jgi:dTDP-4-dehydrorhamnose reductase